MFRGYWIAAIAFGLVLIGSAASGQQSQNTVFEDKPITESGEPHGASKENSKSSNHQKRSINIATSVVNIETSPYHLEAKENQEEDKGKVKREIRDLEAQEQMAIWAKKMYWATLGSIGVGLVSIVLVWRTLEATRDGVRETRRIGEAQTRAYLHVADAEFVAHSKDIEIILRIKNTGISPASVITVAIEIWSEKVTGSIGTGDSVTDIIRMRTKPKEFGNITADGTRKLSYWVKNKDMKDSDYLLLYGIIDDGGWFKGEVILQWNDVFGKRTAEVSVISSQYPTEEGYDDFGRFRHGDMDVDGSPNIES